MNGQHTVNQIAERIRQLFCEVPDELVQHVRAFVTDLVDRGFVGYELNGEGQ